MFLGTISSRNDGSTRCLRQRLRSATAHARLASDCPTMNRSSNSTVLDGVKPSVPSSASTNCSVRVLALTVGDGGGGGAAEVGGFLGGGGGGRWAQPPPRAGGRATTSTCSSSRRMSHRRPIWEHCYVECSAVRREWGSGGARASRRSSRRRSWRAPRAWTLHAASARWTFKKNANPAPVRAAGCAQRRVGGRVKQLSFGASRSGRRGQ